ncbi:MAG: carboxynorspermidine decarboxylase [Bacteroidota bacterium]
MARYDAIRTPAFVLEEDRLRANLELIRSVQEAADVQIILALKAFAMWRVFPLVGEYLSSATASSLHEARLIAEEMGKRAHTYCVAYNPDDFAAILSYSSHLTFNSIQQYHHYQSTIDSHTAPISCGIRVNPEYSAVDTDLYNPAARGSRLGVTETAFDDGLPEGIEGLHFHTLCESSSYELEQTLIAFEAKFGKWLPHLKWVNMGGGHLMTREGYDVPHLIQLLKNFKARYPNLSIILEPGSAIAWQTGPLVTTVLDIVENREVRTVIIDASFTAHMPDTLEMPYRPVIRGAASEVQTGQPTYRIGGVSCLAGDYLAEYSFEWALQIGDRLIFEDMMHYTTVKTTFFNGVQHPDLCLLRSSGELEVVRRFGYADFKGKLG